MVKLNRQNHRIVQRRATAAKIFAVDTFWKQGEFGYATDTSNVYISDDSRNPDGGIPKLVQELRHAIVHNNDVITHDNELVYKD